MPHKQTATPKSSMRSRSPAKANREIGTPSRERARSPAKFSNLGNSPESRLARFEFRDSTTLESPSKNKELRSALKQSTTPVHHKTPASEYHRSPASQPHQSPPVSQTYQSPVSQRSAKKPPISIDTDAARYHAKQSVQRKNAQGTFIIHHPHELVEAPAVRFADYDSEEYSLYSQDHDSRYPSHVSPLRVSKDDSPPKPTTVLPGFGVWRTDPSVPRSESQKVLLAAAAHEETDGNSSSNALDSTFSPLASLLSNEKQGVRKSSKTMIGHNGWLESTTLGLSKPSSSPTRKPGFFDNIMKKAKGMMV